MKFEKHIFICTNDRGVNNNARQSCGNSGGLDIRKEFVKLINESGLKGKVRANKSGCLDICEKGPAVVIYPNAFWYLGIKIRDVKKIFKHSVIGNNPVPELIANKEQLDNLIE